MKVKSWSTVCRQEGYNNIGRLFTEFYNQTLLTKALTYFKQFNYDAFTY